MEPSTLLFYQNIRQAVKFSYVLFMSWKYIFLLISRFNFFVKIIEQKYRQTFFFWYNIKSTKETPNLWSVGQGVKTPPFHGGNTGSNPVRTILKKVERSLSTFFILSIYFCNSIVIKFDINKNTLFSVLVSAFSIQGTVYTRYWYMMMKRGLYSHLSILPIFLHFPLIYNQYR